MKIPSINRACVVILMSVCLLTGCATPSHDDSSNQAAENSGWDDLTAAQKIGHFLAWPLEAGLLYGGSALDGRSL